MDVLVTGATGLLGCHVVESLSAAGIRVHALARGSHARSPLREIFSGFIFKRDLLAEDAFVDIPKVDAVVHCASLVSAASDRSEEISRVNLEGTKRVLEFVKSTGAFLVHVSSVATLGEARLTTYAQSKLAAEKLVEAELPTSRYCVVHPAYMIDEYDSTPSSGAVFLALRFGKIKHCISGQKNFVRARDVAAAIRTILLNRKTGHYTLGGVDVELRDFFAKCCKKLSIAPLTDLPSDVIVLSPWERAFLNEFASHTPVLSDRAIADFAYRPEQDIDLMLERALNWFYHKKILRRRQEPEVVA